MTEHNIKVVELFAGVGGFRIGLEGASDAYETVWNNQWEPSTKQQDASLVYKARFGSEGHSNKDINGQWTVDNGQWKMGRPEVRMNRGAFWDDAGQEVRARSSTDEVDFGFYADAEASFNV